jgi:hypothetical protein
MSPATATPRSPGVSPRKIEREKRKFIGRPNDGKTAFKIELLREVRKGGRKRGQAVGTPSEYEPTGLNWLLYHALGEAGAPIVQDAVPAAAA